MTRSKSICILAALIFGVSIPGCRQGNESKSEPVAEETGAATTVRLSPASIKETGLQCETLTEKQFTKFMKVPAKVLANQDNEAMVGSLIPGRVCKVFVKAGDVVKAGQTLMLVEGLEIGEIKAGFISAKANLEYQKTNYERQKTLFEEKVGAQKTLLEIQNEFEKANAEYNAEKNRINAVGLTEDEVDNGNHSGTTAHESGTLPVKAPIGGVVIQRNVVIGQLIEATTTAFKIVNLSSVWVDGQINEKDAGKITDKTGAEFVASSYPDDRFNGKVTYIGDIIDEKTRTITIRAEFTNADGRLKPQMFGELRLPNESNSTALLVPAEAVVKMENGDYVFIQTEDTVFEKTPVTVCCTQNETIEITKGVKTGDKVVVKGAFYLKSELLKASIGGEE